VWTVGFYDPRGLWWAERELDSAENAADRVAWLNGNSITLVLSAQHSVSALGGKPLKRKRLSSLQSVRWMPSKTWDISRVIGTVPQGDICTPVCAPLDMILNPTGGEKATARLEIGSELSYRNAINECRPHRAGAGSDGNAVNQISDEQALCARLRNPATLPIGP
jgi:hypothetical protein